MIDVSSYRRDCRTFALQPQAQSAAPPPRQDRHAFQGKTWATREHIHIDRLCSAWLILRFIDRKARFIFAPESKLPRSTVLFDVFGAEFSHHGEDCTFETLVKPPSSPVRNQRFRSGIARESFSDAGFRH